MKKMLILGTMLMLSLTSCTNPFLPKKTDGVEIVNEHPDEPQNSDPVEPTTDLPAVSIYTDQAPIICKIRHYKTDSIKKSDLIIQSNGMVWCGFYEQEEGKIGTDNILRKSDGTEITDITLIDDQWMDAFLTETAEDDFMLFGETIEMGQLEKETLDELVALSEKVSPDKVYTGKASADSSVTDYYYTDVSALKGDERVRVPVMAKLGDSKLISTDTNAKKIAEIVMDSQVFDEWEKLCNEKLAVQ